MNHNPLQSNTILGITNTPLMSLWYPKGTDYALVGYNDSDFTGYKLDQKSTNDMYHFLGNSHF